MTYSIVAVDRTANEVGFAIASCNWDAGRVCEAQAALGVIASQGSGDHSLIPEFFGRVESGKDTLSTLEELTELDAGIQKRQIGMVCLNSSAAAFTGTECLDWAGHVLGENYACQGNVLIGPEVLDRMAEAFEQTDGMLYKRLYAALRAGDLAGGDARGRQSAALCVESLDLQSGNSKSFIDFAIEDHDDPVVELGRVLSVGEDLFAIGMMKAEAAAASGPEQVAILNQLYGFLADKREPRYLDGWMSLARGLHDAGETEASCHALHDLLEICPSMKRPLRLRLEAGGLPSAWNRVLVRR